MVGFLIGVGSPDEEDEARETMRDLFIVIVLLIENCLDAATWCDCVFQSAQQESPATPERDPSWVTFQVMRLCFSLSLAHSHLSAWPIFALQCDSSREPAAS